jgi:hypothetical protein
MKKNSIENTTLIHNETINLSISTLFYNILNYNSVDVNINNPVIINEYDSLTKNVFIKFYNNLFDNIKFNKNDLILNIESFFDTIKNNITYTLFIDLYNDYINNYQSTYNNNINNINDYFQPQFLYKYYEKKQIYKYYNFILYYFNFIIISCIYLIINILLFIFRFYEFYNNPEILNEFRLYVALAKGSARLLYFNIILILLPSFINLILYYSKPLLQYNFKKSNNFIEKIKLLYIFLPYYLNFHFHYLCGIIILICSIIHSISHIFSFSNIYNINNCCIWNMLNLKQLGLNESMDYGILDYLSITSIWTGILLIGIIFLNIILICLFYLKKIRHSFFTFIHSNSFIFWFILLLFHGYDNWLRKTQALYWVLPILIIYIVHRKDRIFYLHKVKCIQSDIYKE